MIRRNKPVRRAGGGGGPPAGLARRSLGFGWARQPGAHGERNFLAGKVRVAEPGRTAGGNSRRDSLPPSRSQNAREAGSDTTLGAFHAGTEKTLLVTGGRPGLTIGFRYRPDALCGRGRRVRPFTSSDKLPLRRGARRRGGGRGRGLTDCCLDFPKLFA